MENCIEKINIKDCTGCEACTNICPVNAIELQIDKEGFWYPAINDRCVNCGKCADVCPKINSGNSKKNDGMLVYAAWSLDKDIRFNSTSGGVFSEVALSVLADGGYICGAIYDESHNVKHYITNKTEDLVKIRQSKYVQSYMSDVYKEAGILLKRGEKLLFCASPCQCQGLYNYCKAEDISMEKLVIIDFICRGSNSPKVYNKFLSELETLNNAKVSKVWFKNKTYGWNRFSTKIEFEDGNAYLKDRYHDTFIRGYIEENLYIRPSCTNCSFKGFNRVADITLADFWGVKLDAHMEESDGGTSMVMIHSDKGRKLFDSIDTRIFKVKKDVSDVAPGNVCFNNSVKDGVHREQFMKDIDDMPVIDNIERFLRK